MLNYDIQSGEEASPLRKEVKGHGNLVNPFPGLRPFTLDECHLFFGREGQADELLVKLSENRFVAVMGFSGSGKSSLLYCGLIPMLYGGFMAEAGPYWKVIVTRPGTSPLENLAMAVLQADPDYVGLSEEEINVRKTVIISILRSGANGLIEALKKIMNAYPGNILISVDQFEELFRYKEGEDDLAAKEESALYVNLFLECLNQREFPIFISLAMRSDYIGECAQFSGLTSIINDSNYLVPQMTREQKRMAIEGPIAVGGGKISHRLVKLLLNDMGDNQDQLPIMQHALMRTWDYWVENRDADELMDIRHYNAIGKVSQALSLHANEAFEELSAREKEIAESLFKSLTEKVSDSVGVRRAVRLKEIVAISSASTEEVVKVIDAFRAAGRSFLMPPLGVALLPDTLIEISHESLMRIWTKLKAWVEEEYDSAQMYLRLSEAAAMYQIGRTGLWRPPDLQLALNWQKKQKPTRVWAQRYDEAFERAMVFLDTSRVTYEAEQKNQEMLQKRLLKRAKLVAVVLGIAAVISIVFFLFAINRQFQAEENLKLAEEAEIEAKDERDNALKNKEKAEANWNLAMEKSGQLEQSYLELEDALKNAEYQKIQAQRQFMEAQRQTKLAEDARNIAEARRIISNQTSEYAKEQYQRADQLFYQQLAQSIAVKSLQVEDQNLKALLAYQAYQFNQQYGGDEHDPYVYDAIYYAYSKLHEGSFNTYRVHRDAVKTIVFSKIGTHYYSSGSDGRIVKSPFENGVEKPLQIDKNNFSNRVLKLSPNNIWIVNASDSAYIQLYDLRFPNTKPVIVKGHQGFVYDIAFRTDNKGFYSLGSDRVIRYFNLEEGNVVKIFGADFKTFDISKDNKYFVMGGLGGEVVLVNIANGDQKLIHQFQGGPIHSIQFSRDGSTIAVGDESGVLSLIDYKSGKLLAALKGHKSRINKVTFSNDGRMVASASFDGTIQMWMVNNLKGLPVVFKDNDSFVWDIDFNHNDNYLIAGCDDGEVRLWPTNPKLMVNNICEKIDGNMTGQEWDRYVGEETEYRVTCPDILQNQ